MLVTLQGSLPESRRSVHIAKGIYAEMEDRELLAAEDKLFRPKV